MAIFQGSAKNHFTEATANGRLSSLLSKSVQNFTDLMKSSFRDSFVEDGSADTISLQTADQRYTNLKLPTYRKQYTQRPKTTVLVKKKQFSSLKGNYDTRYLDDEEKLYLRCVKLLHARKCDEIAFYESLINFNSIYETSGFLTIDAFFDSGVEDVFNFFTEVAGLSGLADISANIGTAINEGISSLSLGDGVTGLLTDTVSANFSFLHDLHNLKRKNDGSKESAFTRWIEEPGVVDFAGIGLGSGTMELNLGSTVRTTNGLKDSSASIQINDPYQLMMITESDVEIAVRAVGSLTGGLSGFFDTNAGNKIAFARVLDERLETSRNRRGQPQIIFQFNDGEPSWECAQPIEVVVDDVLLQAPYGIVLVPQISGYLDAKLTQEEIGFVNQILRLMKEYSDTMLLTVDIFSNLNINTAKLRNRMRKDFLGKHIIQPMDEVSIYINSNTHDVSTNNASSPTGNLDLLISEEKNSLSMGFLDQERQEIAPNIPLFLYAALRNRKIFRTDGTSNFFGLVDSVSDTYIASSGEFDVNVNCVSNMEHLRLGRFTFRPAQNNTFGLVNDPLTPFDLTTKSSGLLDTSNGLQLLDQNKLRLPYLYSNSGLNAGFKLTSENDLLTDKEEAFVIQHTPGLIYQWKQGIMTATPVTPGAGILRGLDGSKLGSQFGGFSVVNSPFAGMDAANIASILICGMPYNYTTFLQSTGINQGFSTDSNNNSQFFNYLFDSIGRQGAFNGDFIPAKDTAIDRNSAIAAFEVQKTIKGLNSRIASLLAQKAKFSSELIVAQTAGHTDSVTNKQNLIKEIDDQLASLSDQVLNSRNILPANVLVNLEGNDVFIEDGARAAFDLQNSYRIRRKPEDVRYNKDKNYFVVSSKYDTEYAIQAFVAQTIQTKFDLFNAEYSTPYEIIEKACSALDLEFFADVNGNLILRPPQYNKIPLSLMNQLLRNNASSAVPILPPFILDVLKGREENIRSQILDNELQLAKNIYSLNELELSVAGSLNAVAPLLSFGVILDIDDTLLANAIESLNTSSFTAADRISVTNNVLASTMNPSSELAVARLADVLKQIDARKGLDINAPDTEQKYSDQAEALIKELAGKNGPIIKNGLISKITENVSKRARLLRNLYDVIKNANKAGSSVGAIPYFGSLLTSFSPSLSSNLLSFGDLATGNTEDFGSSGIIRDLTEDDINNNEGPRSSERFIITDDKIISANFSMRPPAFNQVTVAGQINFLPTDGGAVGGIPQIVSTSTDFDSWRQYGFRSAQTIHRPDFTSSNDQCAPYGTLALVRERAKMSAGDITVIGNEYYKAGDNVFVQYRGTVYYVEEVTQSVDLNNGSFTSTLRLTYGRPLGEFIPTPTDLAGSNMLENTAKAAQYRSVRRPISDQATVIGLGTIRFPFDIVKQRVPSSDILEAAPTEDALSDLLNAPENVSALNAAIAKAQTKYSASRGQGRVEIRAYYASAAANNYANKYTADRMANVVLNEFKTLAGNSILNSDQPTTTADGQIITAASYDLSEDVTEDIRKFLPFPSEEAWMNPVLLNGSSLNAQFSNQRIELPVNAVDIVYIVERNNRNKK